MKRGCFLSLETTFDLVVLLGTVLLLMWEFYVDDKYHFKEEQKFRDQSYVFLFFLLCGGKWCEGWSWIVAQDYKRC